MDHSWTIAMVAGVMIEVMILLVGDLMYDTNLSIVSALLGAVVTLIACKIIEFSDSVWTIAERRKYSLKMTSIITM